MSSGAVRWGLIGAGDIVRKRVAAGLKNAAYSRLVSIARGQADKAAEFANEFGIPRHFADWRELIADPEIDAVYVATPVAQHEEQTIAALEAGKHVLCEKPVALDSAAGDRMVDAARSVCRKLGVAYYRRFYPVIRRIQALLAEGTIGDLVIVQINSFEQFDRAPGEPRAWLLDSEQSGGGPMMDFGCHRVDVLHCLFGSIRGVRAFAGQVRYQRAVEDTAGAFLHFSSGGHGTVTVTHAALEPQDTLDIFGTQGSLHVRELNAGDLRVVTAEGESTEQHSPHANWHQPLIEDFVQSIREDRAPGVPGSAAVDVQRTMDAVYQDVAP